MDTTVFCGYGRGRGRGYGSRPAGCEPASRDRTVCRFVTKQHNLSVAPACVCVRTYRSTRRVITDLDGADSGMCW